jgi:hypothetical protein
MKTIATTQSCRPKSNGFVMTSVIVFLGVMGVVLLVLAQATNTMVFQTDRMYLKAVEDNLISSGAAWAAQQLSSDRMAVSKQPTELDATSFSDRPASLSVQLVNLADHRADVRIATSCTKARWTLTQSHIYIIPN